MPSMSISKTPDITSVDTAGQVINYTIVVTNTGSANLTNVTVNDPLLSDESPVLNSGYNTGDTNTNNILDVGEAWNYSGTYTVQQSDIDNNGIDADGVADGDGDIDNTVTADSDQTDPVATSAAVGIVYDPHLAIVKDGVLTDGGDGLNPGDTLDYTFKVTNTGNVTITGVGINEDYFDLFPVHGESIDITPPADVDLSPGEMQTWTGSYTLTQADIDYSFTDPLIDNTASATGQDTKGDDVTSNQDTAQIELPTPPQAELLSLVKDGYYTDVGGDGLNPGDTLTYTFDVTNDSIYTITNVYIDEVSFDLFPIGGSINITPPADTDLSPDESQQWTGEYTLTQDDIDAIFLDNQIDNVAQAIGTDPGGGDTTSNEDPAQITLTPVASLEVNKTVEGVFNADDSPDTDGVVDSAGDYIVYGVTVTNTGEVTLTGVDVQDQVDGYAPVNLYLSGDTNMNGVRDGIEDWTSDGDTNNDGELDVGETWTYSYTYDVQQSDIDVIGNLEWQNSGQEPFQGGSEYDAWFIQGSDYPATGSGVIDSFVRIQANGTEQGYNTDYRPQQFDEGNTATFNHSILVSDIPVVTLQGDDGQSHDYWEFRLDLNEQDGNVGRDQITLDALQLYVSSSNDLTNFDTSTGTFTIDPGPDGMVGTPDDIKTDGTPLYDLGASVDLNEWTSGSGHGDYTVLVPYVEGDYTDQYMYLYSAFSNTDGGFEEWYVRKFGLLDNTATVSTDQGAGGSDSAEVTVAADANYFMDTSAQLAAMNTVTNTLDSTGASVVKTGDLTEDNVIDYTVTLHNDGNVTLGNVEVTDQVEGGTLITLTNHDSDSNTFSGDDNGNGSLDLGETWTYTYTRTFGQDAFDVNGDALLTNTVMVNSDATHTLTATSTVDVSSLIFVGLAMNAHSADWWANHPEAWDGDPDTTAAGLTASDLGMDDVLIPVDSNGDGVIAHNDQQGVLIGDLNADGLTDNGETTLFVPLDAAQQLIDSSGATDMREVLMAEALAAQLNINNMSADSTLTDHPEGPNNLVSEAAMWLRGLGDYSSYDDQTTGNVDTNGDGILSVGNNSNFEFDMKDDLFSADADLSTPMTNKDPGDPLSDADFAWGMVNDTSGVGDDGADLNQALSAFNSGDLVVDPHGGYVGAVDSSGDVVDVHPNAPDAFWDVVL